MEEESEMWEKVEEEKRKRKRRKEKEKGRMKEQKKRREEDEEMESNAKEIMSKRIKNSIWNQMVCLEWSIDFIILYQYILNK